MGNPADFVILNTDNVKDAIRLQPERLFVIKSGKVIARSQYVREMYI